MPAKYAKGRERKQEFYFRVISRILRATFLLPYDSAAELRKVFFYACAALYSQRTGMNL